MALVMGRIVGGLLRTSNETCGDAALEMRGVGEGEADRVGAKIALVCPRAASE